jgi:hypothetical protein
MRMRISLGLVGVVEEGVVMSLVGVSLGVSIDESVDIVAGGNEGDV